MPTALITPTAAQTPSYTTGSSTLVWDAWNTGTTASATSITTDKVWDRWIIQTGVTSITTANATTITATTATGADTFVQWVTTGGANSVTTDGIFLQWTEDGQEGNRLYRPRIEVVRSAPAPITAEQLAERARQRAERERREAERLRAVEAADQRALELLQSVLNDEQNRDLERHGYFFTRGQSGRLYRIGKGRSGNIKVVDPQTKEWTESLCIHQSDYVPVADTMIMQKLMIETAEAHLRAYANITFRNGGHQSGRRGLLTGERLAEIIPFPEREAA